MTSSTRAYLQIHVCVMLWGFTAILGKLITLPSLPLVWWRLLIVVAACALVPRVWRGLRAMSWRLRGAYAGIGAIVALHWLTFYGAIKLSNASVAATCLALGTVFVAMVEPWLARTRFSRGDLALGIAVLPGVALVVGGVPDGMRAGIAVGALSAVLVAVFGALNKRMVEHGDPLAVTALEFGAGVLLLTAIAPLMSHLPGLSHAFAGSLLAFPTLRDAMLLLLMAMVCTLLPFALSLVALRHMSAFAQQLALNLEPVYAIALATLLLGEQRDLTPRFYVGVLVILAAVFIHPLLGRPKVRAQPDLMGAAPAKGCAD